MHRVLLASVLAVLLVAVAALAQGNIAQIRLSLQGLPSAAISDPRGRRDFAVVQLDFTGTREIVHLAGSTLEILFNPQRGPTFTSTARYTVDSNPRGLATADFDGDRHRDIAVLGFAGGQIELLYGNGRGVFTRRASISTPPEPGAFASADFDGDGRRDFAFAFSLDDQQDAVRTLLNRGGGRFAQGGDVTVSNFAMATIASDLDNDGRVDLAVAHLSRRLTVLLNDGAGGWQQPQSYRMAGSLFDVAAADLNGDGLKDLIALNTDAPSVDVLIGEGGGTFAAARRYPIRGAFDGRLTPSKLGVADLTGDGILDVMLANGSLLGGRGDGTFAEPMQFDISAGTIALQDLDGDGRTDILFDHDFTAPPRVTLAFNRVLAANRPPVPGVLLRDSTLAFGEDAFFDGRGAFDPDGHLVLYEWRDELGRIVDTIPTAWARRMPGRYVYTLRLRDTFGGETLLHPTLTVTGSAPANTEIVLHAARAAVLIGLWQRVSDPSAASGARLHHPDLGAPRPPAAPAQPSNYFELTFRPNSQRVYVLSMRGRADRNQWRNDSVYVQFSGSLDFARQPRWRIGTTDALVYSVERCVSCGMAGWGWNFDGIPDQTNIGEFIRFRNDQPQTIRIQSREDGVSIDQIVLSSWTYMGFRYPGTDKRDTIILPRTQ
jgi:hypothetical protein